MKIRFLSIFAAAALLAACDSAPENTGATGKGGQVTPPQSTASQIAPGSIADFNATAGDRVFFEYNKSNIGADAKVTLDKQVAWLKKYPNYAITVEGHADERGTREYNLALGDKRAAATKKYLVAAGLPAARVKTISYGKERPAELGSTEAAWAKNRRAVTVLQ
ncbi:MAG TPA: peptidoglycan-associated lipoprotein Pal [Rhodospirillaceae bacterium]|nr:peptidoglycan-associated lipoprotein Pal [Rhodospirillaceae bacterium]